MCVLQSSALFCASQAGGPPPAHLPRKRQGVAGVCPPRARCLLICPMLLSNATPSMDRECCRLYSAIAGLALLSAAPAMAWHCLLPNCSARLRVVFLPDELPQLLRKHCHLPRSATTGQALSSSGKRTAQGCQRTFPQLLGPASPHLLPSEPAPNKGNEGRPGRV